MSSTTIRHTFGDNNLRREYIQHLLNPNEVFPPMEPVLYRMIGHGPNDHEIIAINALSKHNVLNRRMLLELQQQYIEYQQNQQNR